MPFPKKFSKKEKEDKDKKNSKDKKKDWKGSKIDTGPSKGFMARFAKSK